MLHKSNITGITVRIQHEYKKYIGNLHYSELSFDQKIPDTHTTKRTPNIITSEQQVLEKRSKAGLVPLTEDKFGAMVKYLIPLLQPIDGQIIVFLDFDNGKIYVNERKTDNIANLANGADLLDYEDAESTDLMRLVFFP